MKHNDLVVICLILFSACTGPSDRVDADSAQRAANWRSEITMTIEMSDDAEFHKLLVTDYTSSESLNALADQLFDMAFSGDATIFLPTLFGEPDVANAVNPKTLVDALQFFDSAMVVDVVTGEERDTVIDMSFNKREVSALVLFLGIDNGAELNLRPALTGLGRQVFNPETGERRGVNHKFFLQCQSAGVADHYGADQWILYTDSLGNLYPHAFQVHKDIGGQTLKDWLHEYYPEHTRFQLLFVLSLNALEGTVVMESVRLQPLVGAEVS